MKPLLKIGIVIDGWKMQVFKRHLIQMGFDYQVGDGVGHGTLSLFIMAEDARSVAVIAKAANDECARGKNAN